ncbi:MAG: MFS transporter [Ilumatobacter sp.]|nr:MFS transporter [Ilumatobacter sp.]
MPGDDAAHTPTDAARDTSSGIIRPEKPPTASMWSLFLGLGLLMIGNGLNGAVIGVRSGNEGFGVAVTGVIMAGYFAGFLLAPSLVVRMISSVGHIRVFAGLASTASSTVLVQAVSVVPISWTAMRFVFGFCFAGLYIVMESWLGELSTPATRGRTLSIYMIVTMGGLGIGQYLIAVADPNGFRLFVASSVLVSMALVPVVLVTTARVPIPRAPEKVSVRQLIGFVPTGVLGSFMSGAAAGVLLGLAAVYSSRIGLSIHRTAGFLIAPTIGALLLQWPIGRLSDRVSRRAVIFGVVVIASALCVVGALLPNQTPLVPLVMFGIGGMMFPLYSLVVSYTLDWTPDELTVGAAGTLIRINGSGALLGPLITAVMMSRFGSAWFFWMMASFFGVIAVYLGYRLASKVAMPQDQQHPFVPFPARATNVAIRLISAPVKATKSVGRTVVTRKHERPPSLDL